MTEKERKVKTFTSKDIESELNRVKYKEKYGRTLRSTVYTLITVSAIAILVATLFLPILQIYGTSMAPTLQDGDIVLTVKTSKFETGDVIAFYYNNKILVKRVIATSGDWVNMDEDGDVTVNGNVLYEPYIVDKSVGECNIDFPYQVPEERLFVMGDHRSVSIDSRSTTIGCISQEQIVGKLEFRLWPFGVWGVIE